jgi:VCBS repeat protein
MRGLRLAACVVVILSTALSALAGERKCDRRITKVHVSSDGNGSQIAVELLGRAKVRLLRADDEIGALAVADVDNDGDLDIVVASVHHGLLVWRNSGRGRFVLAAMPKGRAPHAGTGPGVRAKRRAEDAIQFGDDRFTAVLPRAPTSTSWLFIFEYPLFPSPPLVISDRPRPQGRAPPHAQLVN